MLSHEPKDESGARAISFEPQAAITAIATSALGAAFGAYAKEIVKEHVDVIAQEVVGEISKGVAEELAGPLLRVLLRLVDENAKQLEKLINAPARTGISEAQNTLSLVPESPADIRLIEERLQFADNKLAEAINLTDEQKNPGMAAYLHLLRGLIARERSATAIAKLEFNAIENILGPLVKPLPQLEAQFLEESRRGVGGHPGFIISHAGTLLQLRDRIEKAKALKVLYDYALSLRDGKSYGF